MEIFYSTDVMLNLGMGVGQGGRKLSALLVPMSVNPFLSRSLNFFGNLEKFVISGFCCCYLGAGCNSVIEW